MHFNDSTAAQGRGGGNCWAQWSSALARVSVWFEHTSIRQRVAIAFAVPLLAMFADSVVNARHLRDLGSRAQLIVQRQQQVGTLVSGLKDDVHLIARATRNVVLFKDHDMRASQRQAIVDAFSRNDASLAELARMVTDDRQRAVLQELKVHRQRIEPLFQRINDMAARDLPDEAASTLRYLLQTPQENWIQSIEHLGQVEAQLSTAAVREIDMEINALVANQGTVVACSLLLVVASGLFMARSLRRQLGAEPYQAVGVFNEIANGNFEASVPTIGSSQVGMMASVERMRQSMASIVSELQIKAGASASAVNVEQIANNVALQRASREQAESAASMLRAILDNASIGMATASPSGGVKFLHPNAAMCKLLGRSHEELLETQVQDLIHPSDRDTFAQTMLKLGTLADESLRVPVRWLRPDNDEVWTELNMALAKGRCEAEHRAVLQVLDLTERREVDRAKSEFVSVVSHELRTPLTSIMGSLGLVMAAMGSSLPDKAVKLLSTAQRNSNRLLLLINDILDIDKIASGNLALHMQRASIQTLIAQSIESNQPYAAQFNARIHAAAPATEIMVDMDSDRLLQVLANFLSNAAKFSPAGGQIHITVLDEPARVVVQVSDQGTGVPEAFQGRLFSRFSQADSSVTRKKGGTGLGLYISKQIIELMGGAIGYEFLPGRGSTFWFALPKPDAPDPHITKAEGLAAAAA